MYVQYRAGKEPWHNGTGNVHSPVYWTDIPVPAPDVETALHGAVGYFHGTTINYEIRVMDSIGPVAKVEINANPFYENR